MSCRLTAEQQAIVNHTHGAALVFAVAGSGKTTAMVHRIERLVREKVFHPQKILATSFSRASVEDLKNKLKEFPHCAAVKPRTLHSIGYEIINKANKAGMPQQSDSGGQDAPDALQRQILYESKRMAWELNVDWKKELENFDADDFLNWVSVRKGNLEYANLASAKLPDSALRTACQAEAPVGIKWYLDLYCIYEKCRNRMNGITYDDMLMTGWELLHRNPSIRQEMRAMYQCVIVDEFQDVNLAQSEILDLISERNGSREYMAIGDDDQTIYEWRGANPKFILEFEKRYNAVKFIISDNFRCKASQVFLANAIIRHNIRRQKKSLQLTQGFAGNTLLTDCDSPQSMASKMVDDIQVHLKNGKTLNQIAVLIRTYDQTPYFEQCLIKNKIPFRIEGSSPFYRRWEISTLLSYLAIGELDNRRYSGVLAEAEHIELEKRLLRVWNVPKRYLRLDMCRSVLRLAGQNGWAIGSVLQELASTERELNENQRENLDSLGKLMLWLSNDHTLPQNASEIISELMRRTGYKEFLLKSNAIPEAAQALAGNVESLVQYSRDKGNVHEFLQHIRELSLAEKSISEVNENPMVLTIRTIYRAKGLEWPVVLVPNCNNGSLPYPNGEIEAERRLMYVAVTRSKEVLHLYKLSSEKTSIFLVESGADRVLSRTEKIASIISKDPSKWNASQLIEMVKASYDFALYRYFSFWAVHPDYRHLSFDFVFKMATRLVQIGRFLLGKKAAKHFDIGEYQVEPWEEISPFDGKESGFEEFPGLEKLIVQAKSKPYSSKRDSSSSQSFGNGARVHHPVLGKGTIRSKTVDAGIQKIRVIFEDGRTRVLLLDHAVKIGMVQI